MSLLFCKLAVKLTYWLGWFNFICVVILQVPGYNCFESNWCHSVLRGPQKTNSGQHTHLQCFLFFIVSSFIKHIRSPRLNQARQHFFFFFVVVVGNSNFVFSIADSWKCEPDSSANCRLHRMLFILLFEVNPCFLIYFFWEPNHFGLYSNWPKNQHAHKARIQQQILKLKMAKMSLHGTFLNQLLRLEVTASPLMKDGSKQLQIYKLDPAKRESLIWLSD